LGQGIGRPGVFSRAEACVGERPIRLRSGQAGDSLPHAPFVRVWRFQLGCPQVADVRR